MPGPLLVLLGVTAVNAPHAPKLTTVYLETSVSKHFLSNSHSASITMCYLSQLKHLDMNAIVLREHARRPSFIKTKPSSVWELKNATNYSHYVILTM